MIARINNSFLFKLAFATTLTTLTPLVTFSSVYANPAPSYTRETLAQSYTLDIQGWNGTKWGMSVDEVKKLFPGIQPSSPTTTGDSRYVLKDFNVKRTNYDVSFVFGSKGLRVVNLDQKGKNVELSFRVLLQDLQEKYGRPASQNSIGEIKWILPSTEISLLRMANPTDSSKNLLFLSYTPKRVRQDI